MLNSPVRVLGAAMCLFVSSVAGCGGDGARDFGGSSGGQVGTGGGSAGMSGSGGNGDVSGTGGGSATGGRIGSGGRSGTGGRTGTGGQAVGGNTGSGGQASGGVRGSGGVVGSGGRVGSGGTVGSGGAVGSGGRNGSGGNGGANPAICDQLVADYQTEMPNAKTCVVAAPDPQCQIMVASALGCGMNCITFVQNSSMLDLILGKWNANNCSSIQRFCPAIACLNAQKGQCALSTSASVPQCQNALVATD